MGQLNPWKDQQGGDDWKPRFGRKARAWLARRIIQELFKLKGPNAFVDPDGIEWDRWCVDRLIAWYLERWETLVTWVDDDEWRGKRYSNGHWAFSAQAVLDQRVDATRSIDLEIDAKHHPTLDDWLKADIENDLWCDGVPGGMERLTEDARQQVAARRRGLKCPCGKRFLPERANTVYCPECRERRRAEREAARARRAAQREERRKQWENRG